MFSLMLSSVFLSYHLLRKPSPRVFSLHDILAGFMKDHFYRSAHRGKAFSHNFPFLMLTQPRHLSDLMGL